MNVKQTLYGLSVLAVSLLAMTACDKDDVAGQYERVEASFLDQLEGNISMIQWWKTSVTLRVNVLTGKPVKIWAMSDEKNGMLYDYKELDCSNTITMTVPQNSKTDVWLVGVCGNEVVSQQVSLSGRDEEQVTLNMTGISTRALEPETRASYSLYGSSIKGNAEYYQFTSDQMEDYFRIMEKVVRESADAKYQMGLNCNYELESRGPFSITWIAGNCMSSTPHVLGYYYHSPGTYEDIKYVDLSETEVFDIIDGLPKVQYQVNESAANRYDVLANQWYDANFDMRDRWGMTPCLYVRSNDDAWNTMGVYERYRRNITALRGISFVIDVPVGMRLGFYDRAENTPSPEQHDKLTKLGLKPQFSKSLFKGTSFSAEALNIDNPKGTHRSFIEKDAHVMWMGMENVVEGGDLDCNDVIFGVTAELPIYVPEIVNPDVTPIGEYDQVMPWTIAFEDIARDDDFDFNDAVIQLIPDYKNEKCCVKVMAAGSTHKMYLHYDGPEGDVNLGEIHEILGESTSQKVNTATEVPLVPFVEIDCVKWPKEYTMNDDAKRFYIEIQRGTCEGCTDMITLATRPGKIPQALLVAGQWKWPLEGIHVLTAYNTFANWARDNTQTSYWGWHQNQSRRNCVNY